MTWLPSGPDIPVGGPIETPAGWSDLLERRPELSGAGVAPARREMTAARFLRLSQVLAGVNNRVKYRRDLGDTWRVAETAGDCEDYDLAYMVRLLGYGWPRGCLRLALCVVTGPMKFQYHAVLQVDTNHGTWCLDNRRKYPRLWTRLPYRWLWRECPGRDDWEKIGGQETEIRGQRSEDRDQGRPATF